MRHLSRCASTREDCPHASRRSSACGASRRTFSQPGTALATPVLKSDPLTTAAGKSKALEIVAKARHTSSNPWWILLTYRTILRSDTKSMLGKRGPLSCVLAAMKIWGHLEALIAQYAIEQLVSAAPLSDNLDQASKALMGEGPWSRPGSGTESMLGRRGSKSEMSSGSQEGCCGGACTGPQCAWQECMAIAKACSQHRTSSVPQCWESQKSSLRVSYRIGLDRY